MLDLTSYNIEVNNNKPITKAEYRERVEKGLIKNGDVVEVLSDYGIPVKTELHILSVPPGANDEIKKFEKENWKDKHHLKVICKCNEWLWRYMKEKNVIPKDIAEETEITLEKEKSGLMEFWNYTDNTHN